MNSIEALKKKAGDFAASFVKSQMIVGLGEGSTAVYATRKIGETYQSGEITDIQCIPCSKNVETIAKSLGLPVSTLDEYPEIDITIDGADEVDPDLQLIKGGGGALLREKIVATASKREIIIVDPRKLSDFLGEKWAVPIEIIPFSVRPVLNALQELGGRPEIRTNQENQNFITDENNYIVDCNFGLIKDPGKLSRQLKSIPGIVEHGLFIDLATDLVIASPDGIEHRQKDLS